MVVTGILCQVQVRMYNVNHKWYNSFLLAANIGAKLLQQLSPILLIFFLEKMKDVHNSTYKYLKH